jgi:hypothetical protein
VLRDLSTFNVLGGYGLFSSQHGYGWTARRVNARIAHSPTAASDHRSFPKESRAFDSSGEVQELKELNCQPISSV